MGHSKPKIWCHTIFAPKHRKPLLAKAARPKIFDLLKREFEASGCYVECINGMADHVHILHLLTSKKSLSDVMKHVKGVSSHEITGQNWLPGFSWQRGYASYSVSESQMPKVKAYILNQEEHHQTKTFEQEYREFLKVMGLDASDDLMFED